MAVDDRELYFAHTLDVAWIITLWHWIHGGDPLRDSESAKSTELIARGLVGHMARGRTEAPKEIVEKLTSFIAPEDLPRVPYPTINSSVVHPKLSAFR